MADYTQDIQSGLAYLTSTQNTDGGWGYNHPGQSFTEATAWVVLALAGPEAADAAQPDGDRSLRRTALERALAWLRVNQHSDGGWGVNTIDEGSGWMTAYGVWALAVVQALAKADAAQYYGPSLVRLADRPALVVDGDVQAIAKGRTFLVASCRENITYDAALRASLLKTLHIDSNYRGFCWNPGEAGWVTPAGVALVALMLDTPQTVSTEPITNTKDYLRDRQCQQKGWNVGNPFSGDHPIDPTPDATAFALLGLRAAYDPSDKTDMIQAGLDMLNTLVSKSNAMQTKALGGVAYRAFASGTFLDNTRKVLSDKRGLVKANDRGVSDDALMSLGWLNSPYTTALAVLALSPSFHFLPYIRPIDVSNPA